MTITSPRSIAPGAARDEIGSGGYVAGIDGLRALAVLSVLAYHTRESLLPGGFAGVDVFFVISGFVVTASVSSWPLDSLWTFQLRFYARRILRIVPALLVCLLVTALVHSLVVPAVWLSNLAPKTANAAFFGFSNMVLAFNRDHYFSPTAAFNPFVHTWSLGVEEQFYLVFPFVIVLTGRVLKRPAQTFALLSLLSLATAAILQARNVEYAFYLMPSRFWELGAGCLLFLTAKHWGPRLGRLHPAAIELLFGVGIAAILAAMAATPVSGFPFPFALPAVLSSLLLIALLVARPQARLAAPFAARAPIAVGKGSYSLYLWHWPVLVFFRWTVGLDTWLSCSAAIALASLLAWLSYRCIEVPTRRSPILARLPRAGLAGGGVLLILAAAGLGSLAFKAQPALSLSLTSDADLWMADRTTSLGPWPSGCKVETGRSGKAGLVVITFVPQGCPPSGSGRLFIAGDSHASAYAPLARHFAALAGREVRLYAYAGCGYLALTSALRATQDPCWSAQGRITAALVQDLRAGDVVFLPSLRVPRLQDQWDDAEYAAAPPSPADDLRPDIIAEAADILRQLRQTGAGIVFEAPKPVFRSPPFRCADWFNRMNPICAAGFDVPRSELEPFRRPVLARMAALAGDVGGISVWDPFPLLCPGVTCHAFDQGRPFFYDGDHLSAYGNRTLFPSFAREVGGLRP